jgi:hypothetical protein
MSGSTQKYHLRNPANLPALISDSNAKLLFVSVSPLGEMKGPIKLQAWTSRLQAINGDDAC